MLFGLRRLDAAFLRRGLTRRFAFRLDVPLFALQPVPPSLRSFPLRQGFAGQDGWQASRVAESGVPPSLKELWRAGEPPQSKIILLFAVFLLFLGGLGVKNSSLCAPCALCEIPDLRLLTSDF